MISTIVIVGIVVGGLSGVIGLALILRFLILRFLWLGELDWRSWACRRSRRETSAY